jgi:hypothetical protein
MNIQVSKELSEYFTLFLCAMTAVAARIIKASEPPSKAVIFGEILIGLAFCFILAPAIKEYFSLSDREIYAITWAGAYFSGIVLQGIENIIKGYLSKITPK